MVINLNKDLSLGKELRKWDKVNNDFTDTKFFRNLKRFLVEGQKQNKFYPDIYKVFKPFDLCNPDQLKVVIIADTKHIESGLPYGNLFERSQIIENTQIQKIERSIEIQMTRGLNLSFDSSLESWAMQGVLMLNTNLIFEKGGKDSYNKIWRKFNANLIKNLNTNKTGIHYLFLGGKSNYFRKYVNHRTNYSYTLQRPEEVEEIMDVSALERINEKILEQNGIEEIIEWKEQL